MIQALYSDISLRYIRDRAGIDFAAHTVPYSVKHGADIYNYPSIYWRNRKIPDRSKPIQFIHFIAPSGRLKHLYDVIEPFTVIQHNITDLSVLQFIAQELKEELGKDYFVYIPKDIEEFPMICPIDEYKKLYE